MRGICCLRRRRPGVRIACHHQPSCYRSPAQPFPIPIHACSTRIPTYSTYYCTVQYAVQILLPLLRQLLPRTGTLQERNPSTERGPPARNERMAQAADGLLPSDGARHRTASCTEKSRLSPRLAQVCLSASRVGMGWVSLRRMNARG